MKGIFINFRALGKIKQGIIDAGLFRFARKRLRLVGHVISNSGKTYFKIVDKIDLRTVFLADEYANIYVPYKQFIIPAKEFLELKNQVEAEANNTEAS